MLKRVVSLTVCGILMLPSFSLGQQNLNVYDQFTSVTQMTPGNYSLPFKPTQETFLPGRQQDTTYDDLIWIGFRPSKNVEVYFTPEIFGGQGLNGAYGAANFPSVGTFKTSTNGKIQFGLARYIIVYTIPLSDETQQTEAGPGQLGGPTAIKFIKWGVGQFSPTDYFDNLDYAHDWTQQFLNWGLNAHASFDNQADSHGYTRGVWGTLDEGNWAITGAVTQVPKLANQNPMDPLTRGHAAELQGEFRLNPFGHRAVLQVLGYSNRTRARSFSDILSQQPAGGPTPNWYNSMTTNRPDQFTTTNGWAVGGQMAVTQDESVGVFARIGANDGRNENYAFTQANKDRSVGMIFKGATWGRPKDTLGVAFFRSSLSRDQRSFLASGACGFQVCDGQLAHYGSESGREVYYAAHILHGLTMTLDAQKIKNPGYDQLHPSVRVYSLRISETFDAMKDIDELVDRFRGDD